MKIASIVLSAIVAIEHIYFLILEMFLWQKPLGLKSFGTTPEFAAQSAKLAMNQGLYNGFLAAGILWSLFLIKDISAKTANLIFFLACVIVAGVFGAFTAKMSILFIQAMPALLALILVLLAREK